ncbi:hypothetical protein MKW94_026476, partial [Papaver nudicaule]|nr:hypothetical protein [Papaver nudicaule]
MFLYVWRGSVCFRFCTINLLKLKMFLKLVRVCGNPHAIIRKYGLMCCRQCFRSNAKEIGFIK